MVEEADQVAQADQPIVIALREWLGAEDQRRCTTLPRGSAHSPQARAIETQQASCGEPAGSEVGRIEGLQRMAGGDLGTDRLAVRGTGSGVQRVEQRTD